MTTKAQLPALRELAEYEGNNNAYYRALWVRGMAEIAKAEAAMRMMEPGPCGKHPLACYIKATLLTPPTGLYQEGGLYCAVCNAITGQAALQDAIADARANYDELQGYKKSMEMSVAEAMLAQGQVQASKSLVATMREVLEAARAIHGPVHSGANCVLCKALAALSKEPVS